VAKKKISFDIEVEDFEKLKEVVKSGNMGQGDFLRKAVKKALEDKESAFLTIYVMRQGEIKRFTINPNDFDIHISNASGVLKEVCGAVKEGKIWNYKHKRTGKEPIELINFLDILEKEKEIYFFTKS
jgi:hypothetical protein